MSALTELLAGATPARAVGFEIWSATRRDADEAPLGGVIVEVLESTSPETGEIRRSYRVIDPFRLRPSLCWHVLAEEEIDRTLPPQVATSDRVAKVIRRLCEEVAMRERYRCRTGRFAPEHITLVAYAYRLAGVL
jgi:hypothetical protein